MKRNLYLKEFFKYSILNILGMMGLSCYILADTYFVSAGTGSAGLAALNVAIPVYSFVNGSGLMLGMGGATKFSVCKSKKEPEAANNAFFAALLFAAVFSVFFVISGLFFSKEITRMLGANADIFEMTNIYLKVILLFSPAFILNDIFVCFVRNDNNPRLSMLAMLAGSFSNIILDYVFIFPLKMGIFGAVLATGIAPVISMSILSAHWIRKKNTFHFRVEKVKRDLLKGIILTGFPSFVAEVSSGIVIIVFNLLMLKAEGNIGVAAYGITANISLVVVAVYTGMAQGIQPLVSRLHGCGDAGNMKKVFKYAIISSVVASAAIYAAILLNTGNITSIFNMSADVVLQAVAERGLKLYFAAIPFVGFNIIISTYFSACEKNAPAHVISLLRGFLLIIPAAVVFSEVLGTGGIWISFPVCEFTVAAVGIILYFMIP